jgi:hypothetical protein
MRVPRRAEVRFLATKGGVAAKAHHKASPLRTWWRNAELMARHWPEAH